MRSPALAATWGKIEIRADDQLVTRFWSAPGNSVRTGVYASAFPLASWIVRNWWTLLHERLPAPEVLRGARRGGGLHRAWLERHNLFFSRDGMAYPDLSMYREDDAVGLRWVADPEAVTTPGRFLDSGFQRIDVKYAEAVLAQLVEAVIERLHGIDDSESNQLRADWHAIQHSLIDEPKLCARLGELGLDPYSEETDESVEEALEAEALPELLIGDLLAATTPPRLNEDLADVRLFLDQLPASSLQSSSSQAQQRRAMMLAISPHHLPYRAGYARAEALRDSLRLSSFAPGDRDPASIVRSALGAFDVSLVPSKVGRCVDAVVERNGVLALAAEQRAPRSTRFLLARALHHWMFVDGAAPGLRLLTRANDWQQAASRAFAAELLAPAAALATRLEGRTDWDVAEELAEEFNVHPMVIAHQLENHGLG